MTATRRKTRWTRVALVAAGTVALTSCGILGPDSGQDVAGQFTDALADRDVDRAAALTDDPAAAADVLRRTFDGLGADTAATFTVESADDSRFTYRSAWDFGGGRVWDYSTTAALHTVDGDRRVDWSAAVLNERLQPGQALQFTPIADTRAVLDANAMPLMAPQTVTVVDADPRVLASDRATAARVTALLGGPVPGFTLPQLDPASERINLVSLRQDDAAPIRAELETLPGVLLSDQLRLLTVDRTLISPLVAGIRQEWEARQQQSSGWRVQTVNPDGEVTGTLAGGDPADGTVVRTTIDPNVQRLAQQAVDTESRASALVALDASSGRVLAVAQNKPADASGPIALTGLYPPGSTFKTITTTAALGDGTVTADSIVDCPGTATIEGRTIPNDDEFDLGRVPLHTAFAHSCNTTMGKLAVGMAPDELQQQALDFGLGVDYVTPGMTTVTGSVPSADTPAQRVEAAIGQGENLASPFGMAMVAATVGAGQTPLPQLIAGEPGTADHDAQAVDPGRLDALRAMMTETVDAGTATSLTDIPGLMGKTGTAEAGNSAHGWFVGVDGNIAFAVLVVDGDSSRPALDIAGKFLRPLG